MDDRTLTLTGISSEIQEDYFPALDLSDGNYICGLVDFTTFNSIPNVDESNNLFYCGYKNTEANRSENKIEQEYVDIVPLDSTDGAMDMPNELYSVEMLDYNSGRRQSRAVNTSKNGMLPLSCVEIPTGSYEVEDLAKYLKKVLATRGVNIEMVSNKNTLKCEIMCSQPIDFTKPNSIGTLLGFGYEILKPNRVHISQRPADILRVDVIRINCDIIKNSHLNAQPSLTIHQFSPTVPPGYKIVEVPNNVIYLPITVKSIHTIHLSIVDQENKLINFRGERITIRLHIKKV